MVHNPPETWPYGSQERNHSLGWSPKGRGAVQVSSHPSWHVQTMIISDYFSFIATVTSLFSDPSVPLLERPDKDISVFNSPQRLSVGLASFGVINYSLFVWALLGAGCVFYWACEMYRMFKLLRPWLIVLCGFCSLLSRSDRWRNGTLISYNVAFYLESKCLFFHKEAELRNWKNIAPQHISSINRF